ncbi:MAG: sulfite exporter TauE/SafE family protein, partial [Alphaproteobacteria bacterium]|nr:sulfite exporter TauE/SafE family protein [Alphaproteobacteria bacterium]
MTVFWPTIVGVGLAVGVLSGMFGVGGGFLISPLLMFLGIPTEVAVATGANQAAATSASAATAQWKSGNVDLKMAGLLLGGGALGSFLGVFLVSALRAIGQIEFVISVCYALLLGTLGLLMLIEGASVIRRSRRTTAGTALRSRTQHTWIHGLPFKTRFPRSKLYMSVIPPLVLGVIVGILGAVMGVGGGFLLVPAMVYLLKVPTQVVVGTSLIQVLVISSITTILHAYQNKTVDMELAILLIVGGVIGAQWGARAGARIKSEQL